MRRIPAILLLLPLLLAPPHARAGEPSDPLPHPGMTRRRLREAIDARDMGNLAAAAHDCVRLREKGLRPLWDGLTRLCTEEVGPRPAHPRPDRLEEEDMILRSLEQAFLDTDPDVVRRVLSDVDLEVRSSRRLELHLAWARMIARVDLPAAGYFRQRLFSGDGDWRARAAAADLLAQRSGSRLPEALLRATQDPSWPVRRIALGAIVRAHAKAALPRLMAMLDQEHRPGREDVFDALRAVTGKNFGDRDDLWKRWWAGEIGVPEQGSATPVASGSLGPITGSARTGFFGLPIRSRRALFLLDVSASMSDVPRRMTGFGTGRPAGTKWSVVRAELHRALQSLPEGARFALIVYEEELHAWRPVMIPATPDVVRHALDFAGGFEPGGGTDLLQALEYAFDFAVASGDPREGPGVDTIFLLSDGLPTLGDLVRPADLLDEVARRNRTLRLRIHTIAAGEHDREFLTALAAQNAGIAVDLLPERP